MNSLIIGKRITVGQIIMGIITMGAFIWDSYHPDNPIPAGVLSGVSQTVVGLAQLIVVNVWGVTTK